METQETFLPQLNSRFKKIVGEEVVPTREFTSACEAILPIFDHLGTVFVFAKNELAQKKDSLRSVEGKLSTLNAVVEADAKAGKATVKNSCARNLHRLLAGIDFISKLLQYLAADRNKPLRQAAAEAYDATLAKAHGMMVRMGVRTSMYMLPTREVFLASINESEDSAKAQANDFVPRVNTLVAQIEKIYVTYKIVMPASDARGI